MAYDHDYEMFKSQPEMAVESDEFVVEFDNDIITLGRYIDFQNVDLFSDYIDPNYKIIIARGSEIEEHINDFLVDLQFFENYPDGKYKLSGWAAVPYDIYYPEDEKPTDSNMEIDVRWSDIYYGDFVLAELA